MNDELRFSYFPLVKIYKITIRHKFTQLNLIRSGFYIENIFFRGPNDCT